MTLKGDKLGGLLFVVILTVVFISFPGNFYNVNYDDFSAMPGYIPLAIKGANGGGIFTDKTTGLWKPIVFNLGYSLLIASFVMILWRTLPYTTNTLGFKRL